MPIIYHVTSVPEWELAKKQGFYETSSLKNEGFIHCSENDQVNGVLQRYFTGKKGLLKLSINTDKLTSRYIQEWSRGSQDTFPHVYGPINLESVETVETV